ncbi:hypothetical protein [Yersinia proxima]|uniref:hypothetical protein n=1 Tax=Yersinia proxima TaxID=2890316 RepID=UPI001D118BA2|nr:hypothetical protein [Yersinia proxima]
MKSIIIIFAVLALAGCAPQYKAAKQTAVAEPFTCEKPSLSSNTNKSPVESMIGNMKGEAAVYSMKNYGYGIKLKYSSSRDDISLIYSCNNTYLTELTNQMKSEVSKAKESTKKPKEKELILEAYSKWATHMQSIDPDRSSGTPQSESEFKAALNRLEAESI